MKNFNYWACLILSLLWLIAYVATMGKNPHWLVISTVFQAATFIIPVRKQNPTNYGNPIH